MNMFCRFSFVVLLLIVGNIISGQNKTGIEWINPSKVYYKLKLAENGIYRVTYEDLQAAGWTHGQVASSDLRLVNYGTEQAIHVSGPSFGPGAWFEFYGEKNTIGLDSLLFKNWKKDLLNTEYSFVSDTNAYFLTLAPESVNLRYTQVNPDYSNVSLTPFPYYLHNEKVVYSSTFFKNVDGDVRNSFFEPSEGFASGTLQSSNTTLPVSSYIDSGPQPVLSFRLGQNNQQARLEISWNGQLKESVITNAKSTSQFSYTLDKTEMSSSNTLGLKNVLSSTDRHIIAYASLKYPRAFSFNSKPFYLFSMDASSSKRLLQISDFNTEGTEAYLYDFKNRLRYATGRSGNKVLAIVNPVSSETAYALTNTITGYKTVPSVNVFKPRSFSDKGSDYIIISNKNLYAFGPDYGQEYADYRSSTEGGSYKTEIIGIQDIYDHFGYGIDRHFVAVKNMASYLKENWKSVRFVMVLGKGVEYPLMRTQSDVLNNLNKTYFIPTFGFYPSDNMLFSEGNFPDPYFAIGRLSAKTGADINNYLDKIKHHDLSLLVDQTISDKYWTKKVLHLGGGKTEFEQTSIQNGLNAMATLLKDTVYGAEVFSYFKNSADVIQFSTNEEINDLIDNGVSLINFFGHSSSNNWEFSIQDPKNNSNFGKYPFINSFGCASGNLYGLSKSISESFVLEKDKGSVSFFASTGTAFISSLSSYGHRFFDTWLNKLRYKSIGEVITLLANQNRNSQYAELALYSQLTYHGDPALKLFLEKQPDYLFDETTVHTVPSTVLASSANFDIELNVVNLGAYILDSLNIAFYHYLPDGKLANTVIIKSPAVANNQKVTVSLKNYGQASVGKNKLLAILDHDKKISEGPLPAAENNNELVISGAIGYEFFVTDNVASAIYPPDFAMINTSEHMTLKASTSAVPVAKGNYVFQIDTTAYFNSPLLETGKVESTGGLITYKPGLSAVPNRVYYWRVSPDSTSAEGYKWSSASFAYLPEEAEGWNQSHFFQFTQNSFEDLEISEETERKFEFEKLFHQATFTNKLWDNFDFPGYTFDNVTFGSVRPWLYMSSGIAFVIYRKRDGVFPRNAVGGEYGSINPTSNSIAVFPFKTETPTDRQNIIKFIDNFIQKDDYVTIFTVVKDLNSDLNVIDWENDKNIFGTTLFEKFASMGSVKFSELKNIGTVPYFIQLEKMSSGFKISHESIALNKTDVISNTALTNNFKRKGFQNSSDIGPSLKLNQLKFEFENETPLDRAYINLRNSDNNLIIDSLIEVNKDLSSFGIKKLKLESHFEDTVSITCPQLKFWRVSYEPVPDAAISFIKSEPNPANNEVNQGEKIRIFYEVSNVNFVAMDSILVKYSYTDNNNQLVSAYKRLGKLGVGQKISDMIEFSVGAGNTSEMRFIIEINPNNDQPELHHFNNILTRLFKVSRDKDNPLLDVYFDGIHIMDGDIVSPKPDILITLEDENTLLPVTDPNLFEVKLDTGRNQLVEIPMNSPQISFTPAGNGNKTARVLFTPTLKEGDYKLIVQARDASGNKSGINPRVVSFRVIERQSVSNVLNYPNPFSTSTQFIFTLTGAEMPDVMSLSVMTVTGKVVREITKEELGPLHIGVNKTEYRWDGTDDFGSKLANGVYLYKVNVRKSDGSVYDSYSSGNIDSYFTKGFGKLVILR